MKALPVLGVAVALATTAAGASARTAEAPGTFMIRILREELTGQWGRQWSELHPGHQRLITRAQYIACSRELATNIGTGHEVYNVLQTANDAIHIFGVPQRTAKVVTISFHTPGNNSTPTYRMHAVSVGGHWSWVLGGRFLRAVQHGRCMDGSALIRPGRPSVGA